MRDVIALNFLFSHPSLFSTFLNTNHRIVPRSRALTEKETRYRRMAEKLRNDFVRRIYT